MQKARINAYNIKMAVKLKQEKAEARRPLAKADMDEIMQELAFHYQRLIEKFTYYDDEFHIPVRNGVTRG